MASYDRTITNRRTGATGTPERIYSRTFAAARRAARRRGDRIVVENIDGVRVMTITDRDLRWQARYVEVARGAAQHCGHAAEFHGLEAGCVECRCTSTVGHG